MKVKYVLLGSIFGAVASGSAGVAADTGFYAGGSVGSSYLEAKNGSFKLDGDDLGYKGFVGFQLLSLLAVEAGYVNFGEVNDKSNGIPGEVAVDGWDAFVVGNLPLGPLNVFAKGGMIAYEAELKAAVDELENRYKDNASDQDLAFGLGASIELGDLAVRAEYEYFDASDLDNLSLFSVGLVYQF
ncbi:outer membrane beta-barrel protein [Mangrovimicrobium sediminis]|nr:outer membrane beta-barrel protein [Haliea sp. SAOS-164]